MLMASKRLKDAQRALDVLVRETRTQAEKLARDAAERKISPTVFGDRMAALLEERHALAVVIGRQHAGDMTPLEDDDRKFAALIVDAEAEFLSGFVADLGGGRYADKADAAAARAHLYGNRLTGSASEAWGLTIEQDVELHWELGASGVHCEDCPRIAAGSPYTPESIPTWPGMAGTQCLAQCNCSVRTTTQAGFQRTD